MARAQEETCVTEMSQIQLVSRMDAADNPDTDEASCRFSVTRNGFRYRWTVIGHEAVYRPGTAAQRSHLRDTGYP
jgi:hypothetical protein